MSITNKLQWRALGMRTLHILLALAVLYAISFWWQPYPCQGCKKTGKVPGTTGEVECGACKGDGRNSIGQKFMDR